MALRKRYVPNLEGMPAGTDPQVLAVLRRNLEMISSAIGDGAGGGGLNYTILSGSANVPLPQTPHDHVLTRHITADWPISERVAVTGIVFDNPSASVIFSDADTVLVEIAG